MNTVAAANPLSHQCPQCGSTRLGESLVKSAFWHNDRLVLVEGIPAIVCGDCGERFYDDATATMLDLMQGEGYPEEAVAGRVEVPVFFFTRRVSGDPVARAETEA